MNLHEALKMTFLFSDLSVTKLSAIKKICRKIECNENEMLFFEGDPAKSLYIAASGTINLIKSSSSGREQLIRSVSPGEIFAEAAMFAGMNYPVTALAKSKAVVYAISKENLLHYIRTNPDASLKMMGAMSKLLKHLNRLVGELALGSVSDRLAKYLINKYKETGQKSFAIGMKKKDLALKLGTISETLSRNINRFKRLGLIKVERNRVTIRDLKKLEKLT